MNGLAEIRRANRAATRNVALLTREQADVAAGVLFEALKADLTNEQENAVVTLHHALVHDDAITIEPGEEENDNYA
jgi:hypothetical protein